MNEPVITPELPEDTGNIVAREIKLKTFKGASAMFVRQILIAAINLAASIVLARQLSPSDFGIYVMSSFIVNTVMVFSDVGLGAALIQQNEEPSLLQYRTIFSSQFILVATLVSALFFTAPVFVRIFNVEERVVWFVRGMSLTMFISTFGSVSGIMLERRLAYNMFARIDVISAVIDKAIVVSLALSGFGYQSFLVAALCGSLARSIAIFMAAPWQIGFFLDTSFLKSVISFGGMFQMASIIAIFRDNLSSLLVGPLFGPVPVGYLNWAHNIAMQGSQIFTQIVNRINFPSLSRVQDNQIVLSDIVSRTLRLLNVITIPILMTMMTLINEIVANIYTSKWVAAIPAFYCYAVLMIGGNVTTTLSGFLLATGRAKLNLVIMACWTMVVWALAIVLTHFFGFVGAAAATVTAVMIVSVVLIVVCNKVINIRLTGTLIKPICSGLLSAIIMHELKGNFNIGLIQLVVMAILGVVLSIVLNVLIDKDLLHEFKLMFKNLKRDNSGLNISGDSV